MARKPEVFFVSKALNPPFDDSGKLLPFLIATHNPDLRFHVPVNKGQEVRAGNVHSMPIFTSNTAYKAGLWDKAALFWHALRDRHADILHFFFSPNKLGNRFGRTLAGMRRGLVTVQTIMSLPMQKQEMQDALFADWVVTWSKLGQSWAEEAAQVLPEQKRPKVVHIPPGIIPLQPLQAGIRNDLREKLGFPADRFLVLYPGDLEFTDTAITVAHAARRILAEIPGTLVMAMRPKTEKSEERLQEVRRILKEEIEQESVRILGSIDYFQDLLSVSDLVLLPAPSTYAKTDIPLAVLEAMSSGVPAVVGQGSAMQELSDAGVAIGVTPGDADALSDAVIGLCQDRTRLRDLGKKAAKYVQEFHTVDHMARAFARVYMQAIKR